MLKLPFFNRERYIVIKAYTFDRLVHKDKTLGMTGTSVGVLDRCPVKVPIHQDGSNFSTCYGMNAAMNRSLTLSSWCELDVEYRKDSDLPDFLGPPDGGIFQSQAIKDDHIYKKPKDSRVYKLLVPWLLTCNKNVNFVMASHLMNTTPMQIPTGLLNFEATTAIHLFTILHPNQKYKVPYRHPLAQIFPLSDLPIHLETYWDREMFQALFDSRLNRPYFRANGIKLVNQKNA